ncbi:MAG: 2Fe-2S iron-sulfur cluster-binding protein [Rhizobiaceae bacterium]|nr:2Fe-2S iron-sulfur cluster-binding protein [Rhizobiaceae bacterium]
MPLEYHKLEVTAIEPTASDAVCVSFKVPDKLEKQFDFIPGQHLTLRGMIDGEELRRFYSICSSQNDPLLRIGVRQLEDGRFSGFLNTETKVGDQLDILVPRGLFRLNDSSKGKHVLAFAAGSGITPVYSIIHNHLESDAQSTATLVYGNRTISSIMLLSDLNDLKDKYLDRFQLVHILSREQQDNASLNGRIDKDNVKSLVSSGLIEPQKADEIFICGPADMIDSAQQVLISLGADGDNIKIERFTGNENVKKSPSPQTRKIVEKGVGITYILDGVEKSFPLEDPADTILGAAKKSGHVLPFSCAGGMCATCRCKLIEGEVEMDANYSLEPWELEAGYVLACQSRPKTEKIKLDFDVS